MQKRSGRVWRAEFWPWLCALTSPVCPCSLLLVGPPESPFPSADLRPLLWLGPLLHNHVGACLALRLVCPFPAPPLLSE